MVSATKGSSHSGGSGYSPARSQWSLPMQLLANSNASCSSASSAEFFVIDGSTCERHAAARPPSQSGKQHAVDDARPNAKTLFLGPMHPLLRLVCARQKNPPTHDMRADAERRDWSMPFFSFPKNVGWGAACRLISTSRLAPSIAKKIHVAPQAPTPIPLLDRCRHNPWPLLSPT
jgi:hypothetical protein